MLVFVFSLFGDDRDGESFVRKRREGGFSSAAFVVVLVVSRIVAFSRTFAIVTFTEAMVSATASGVLLKSAVKK